MFNPNLFYGKERSVSAPIPSDSEADDVSSEEESETEDASFVPQQIQEVDNETSDSLSSEHVFSNDVRTTDNIKGSEFSSIKFDGFQALSDAVRAFVCITCGAKIVGKDLYFKHIQEKCSMEGNSLLKVSDDKSKANTRERKFLEEKSSDCSLGQISATQSLSSCYSDYNLLENGSSLSRLSLNKDGEFDRPKTINLSKSCDEGNHEIHKEEIKPYIHKKFDHDQERKIAKVPSSDVQCYIQNFQSLLVDKLNKTLESDNNKLPFMKNIENNNFFEVEKEINFRSPNLDCDINKPSPVASLSPEKLDIVHKDSSVRPLTSNKSIRCKFCPKTFSKPYLLLRHQLEFHSSTTYYCNLCGNHFKSKRTLANHKGTHKEKTFHCTKCNYSCFTASGLRTHVFENHSKKRKKCYLCTLCPETFKKKYGLDRHIKRKHEENRMLCQFCDKLFSCKEDLNLHMAVHLNDKSLTCCYCGKQFTSHSSLKRHKSTHNTKRESFNCNKCSKIFTRKDSLQSHIKLHE